MSFPAPFSYNLQPDFEASRDDASSVFTLSEDQDQDQDQDQDEESVEECPECDIHEITGKPINPEDLGECPICYEQLTMINTTITRCGHAMHSSCIFMALEKSACCPMCRTQVIRKVWYDEEEDEDEDEERDDDQEDDQEQDQEDDQEEEDDVVVSVEQLATKLQNMGYTMADVLTMFFAGNIKQENNQRYTQEFLEKIDENIDGILNGSIALSSRDTRSYADVVKTPRQIAVPPQEQSIA